MKRKANLKELKAPATFSRDRVDRSFGRHFNAETAARAIGDITPGMDVFGFTKGQFSKIDILEHCLRFTGPADVSIGTWSASHGDIQRAYALTKSADIRSLRFLVDFSFKARKPHFLKSLLDAFGPDCVRMTVIHAKFALIRNDDWNLVLRTSMNLNHNPRFENFELTDNREFADFMAAILDEIWAESDRGEALVSDTGAVQKKFRGLYAADGFDSQNSLDLVPGDL